MIKRLYRMTDKGYAAVIKSSIALGIFHFMGFAAMLPIMHLVDEMLAGGNIDYLWYIITSLIIVAGLFISYKVMYRIKYISAGKENSHLRMMVADKIRRLPSAYLGKRDISDFTSTIMDDITTIEGVFANGLIDTIGGVIYAVMVLIILAFINLKLTIYLAICCPLAVIATMFSKVVSSGTHHRNRNKRLVISERIQEYLDNIKILKFSNDMESYEKEIERNGRQLVPGLILFEFLAGMCISIAYNIMRLGIVFVAAGGARLLISDEIGISTFILFLLASFRVYEPLSEASEMMGAVLASHVAMGRISEILDYPEQEGAENVDIDNYDISFDHVSFGYDKDTVIRDVTCTARQGEYTAIVGPSGSGKSTLLRLAARFWDIQEGSITIGGVDIRGMAPEEIFRNYSIVFQDVVLFNDSIYNNILIGNKDATREEVIEAAHLAECDSFIDRLPDGIDTIIGENGHTLSGGERQRLSIARAFLKKSPIILLDESTASLDPETESKIQNAIDKLTKGKTVIMIAHRLRTIVNCDRIIVLDNGRIVGNGRHADLMRDCTEYQKLYNIQMETSAQTIK